MGESAVRGRGRCVHWLWGGGGDYTVAEDWITERGGAALPYLFSTYFKSVAINVAFFVAYICTTILNSFQNSSNNLQNMALLRKM